MTPLQIGQAYRLPDDRLVEIVEVSQPPPLGYALVMFRPLEGGALAVLTAEGFIRQLPFRIGEQITLKDGRVVEVVALKGGMVKICRQQVGHNVTHWWAEARFRNAIAERNPLPLQSAEGGDP